MAGIPSFGGPFNYNVKLPDIATPADLMQVQGAQTQNALANAKLAESVRGIEARNAMGKLFANADPQTGLPPVNALAGFAQQFPDHAMALQKQIADVQHNQMLTKLEEEQIADRKQKAKLAAMPYALSAFERTHEEYQKGLDAGNPDPRADAVRKGLDVVKETNNAGLYGGLGDDAKTLVTGYDPVKAPQIIKVMRDALAKQGVEKSTILVNDKGQRIRLDGQGEAFFYDSSGRGGYVPYQGSLEGFKPINQPPQQSLEIKVAQAEAVGKASEAGKLAARAEAPQTGYAAGYESLTPAQQQTVDFYATMQLGGDNTWRVGLSRNKGGSDLIKAVDERVPDRASELGLSPADIGTNKGVRIATQAALTANTKDLATLKPYVAMLDQNADILKGLAKKAILTNAALANRPLNWLRTNAADSPDVADYLAQIEIVKNEATRVISNPRLVGQMTDTARHEIETIINGTMPLEATNRVIDRLKNDSARRIDTMQAQQNELQSKLKTLFPTGKSEASAPEALPPKDQLVAGKVYQTPRGPAKWNGTAFEAQ